MNNTEAVDWLLAISVPLIFSVCDPSDGVTMSVPLLAQVSAL